MQKYINTKDFQKLKDNNISFIPVIPEKKTPLVKGWKQFQLALPTPQEINDFVSKQPEAVACICGAVSSGLEIIDFDLKYDSSGTLFDEYLAAVEDIAPGLLDKMVIQETPSKGWHFIYRCADYEGNLKLAKNANGETVIETRGEGGYFLIDPSKSYKITNKKTVADIQIITPAERKILFDVASGFNQHVNKPNEINPSPTPKRDFDGLKPGEDYNQRGEILDLLQDHGWTIDTQQGNKVYLKRPGKPERGWSATWNYIPDKFYVFSSNAAPFEAFKSYSKFAVYAILKHDGNFQEAARELSKSGFGDPINEKVSGNGKTNKNYPDDCLNNYIRIGTTYYKKTKEKSVITKIPRLKLEPWTAETIKLDFSNEQFKTAIKDGTIERFDGFCNEPDFLNYKRRFNNRYNIFEKLEVEPKRGSIENTLMFLEGYFGDKLNIGLDWIAISVRYPTQKLPSLGLVSTNRSTGKTSFLDWLTLFFGEGNSAVIGAKDWDGNFNAHWVGKFFVGVDENFARENKVEHMQYIKYLLTANKVHLNEKQKSIQSVDNNIHLVLASNDEDKFIQIDEEENRWFILKTEKPKKEIAHFVQTRLNPEIPAALYYFLYEHKLTYEKPQTRFWFPYDSYKTEQLGKIVNATKPRAQQMIDFYLFEKVKTYSEMGKPKLMVTEKQIFESLNGKNIDRKYIKEYLEKKGYSKTDKTTRFTDYILCADEKEKNYLMGFNGYSEIDGIYDGFYIVAKNVVGTPYTFEMDNFSIDGDLLTYVSPAERVGNTPEAKYQKLLLAFNELKLQPESGKYILKAKDFISNTIDEMRLISKAPF